MNKTQKIIQPKEKNEIVEVATWRQRVDKEISNLNMNQKFGFGNHLLQQPVTEKIGQ